MSYKYNGGRGAVLCDRCRVIIDDGLSVFQYRNIYEKNTEQEVLCWRCKKELNMHTVKVKKLHKDAVIPQFAHNGDAGADLVSIEDVVVPAGERVLVGTGIAIALDKYMEAQIRPRSGLAAKNGITVLNSPGTIDCFFRGEVRVILYNTSKEAFKVEKGMRIAQMVLAKLPVASYVEVTELSETERGVGGFGSTGI